ncbi:MAG: aspartate aminotransferase family protein [Hadesarchaea archaeon]|nr:aspartate aminotransferase family protein [Hadesarchaea archaeon]
MKSLLELYEKYVARTYERQPIVPVEGEGVRIRDINGKEYIDFVAGIAVCSLGHCHPEVVRTIKEQAEKLMHVSNLYYIKTQAELAEALAEVTPPSIEKFFFCNSGAEAVEAAFKLAVRYTGRERIVAMRGSFHGRSAAAVGATWNPSYREPFTPLIPKIFDFIPFGDLDAARDTITERTAAVIAEPIQGEGGVNVPPDDFLPGLRELCDDSGALLIFDEIQCGMGRTGKWFACEHWGVEPDIITIAKALGNGFPIGCMGAKPEVMASFSPGDHASTFGGNPLACAVAKTVIRVMKEEKLPQRAAETGSHFKKRLEILSEKHGSVEEARGLGLMLALELKSEEAARKTIDMARERGYLINRTAGKVLRFVPPLIIEKKDIDGLAGTLDQILEEVEK